ncbi:MAG: hypothetical protein LBL83_03735 [Clostridiales bacterium]|jgi:hypothetical protein|nr:hypothetical protein [Clostridiales bacterium]
MSTLYSTTSDTTRQFCEEKGFIFDVHFVETMRRGGAVYVNGVCGKPQWYHALAQACDGKRYIYTGPVVW